MISFYLIRNSSLNSGICIRHSGLIDGLRHLEIMKKRIAFDLDETLGIPIIEQTSIVGFRTRDGATDILNRLQQEYSLLLWTVSKRSYVEKSLSF
jgi:hypothetical protein